MGIHDRWNPRLWLRGAVSRTKRWLYKQTPAEAEREANAWARFVELCGRDLGQCQLSQSRDSEAGAA